MVLLKMSGNVGPAPPEGAGHEVDGCQTHHHVAAKERSVELIRLRLCLLTLFGGDGPARFRSSDGAFFYVPAGYSTLFCSWIVAFMDCCSGFQSPLFESEIHNSRASLPSQPSIDSFHYVSILESTS